MRHLSIPYALIEAHRRAAVLAGPARRLEDTHDPEAVGAVRDRRDAAAAAGDEVSRFFLERLGKIDAGDQEIAGALQQLELPILGKRAEVRVGLLTIDALVKSWTRASADTSSYTTILADPTTVIRRTLPGSSHDT